MVFEPETHGGSLGVSWLQLERALVMGASAGVIAKWAGAEAAKAEMGRGIVGVFRKDLLEFRGGVVRVSVLFECQSEVQAGLGVIGLQGEGMFVGGERLGETAGGVSGNGQIVLGLEHRGIGLRRGAEMIEGLGGAKAFLGIDALLDAALGFGAVAGGGFGRVLVAVTASGRDSRGCRRWRRGRRGSGLGGLGNNHSGRGGRRRHDGRGGHSGRRRVLGRSSCRRWGGLASGDGVGWRRRRVRGSIGSHRALHGLFQGLSRRRGRGGPGRGLGGRTQRRGEGVASGGGGSRACGFLVGGSRSWNAGRGGSGLGSLGLGGGREFLLKLAGDRQDGGWRVGIGGEELPVFLQGERAVFEVLLGGDGSVEQSGGVSAGFGGGGGELPKRFHVSAAMDQGEADSVEGGGRMGIELEDAGVAAFGGIDLAETPVGAGESHPAVGVVGLQGDVSGELSGSGGGIALIEVETSQVISGGGEVAVEAEGALVGGGGIVGMLSAMVGEPEEIPGAGVVGEQPSGLLQRGDGIGEIAGLDEAFSLEDGPGPGGDATGSEEQGRQTGGGQEGACGSECRARGVSRSRARRACRPAASRGFEPPVALVGGVQLQMRPGGMWLRLFDGQHLGGW